MPSRRLQFPNQIVFDIPETDPGKNPTTGAFVIKPLSALPAIFNPAVIDGYTQPGASANTNPIDQADNAHIRIELDGSKEGLPNNGFDIYAQHTRHPRAGNQQLLDEAPARNDRESALERIRPGHRTRISRPSRVASSAPTQAARSHMETKRQASRSSATPTRSAARPPRRAT